jgi:hypothetical protein
MQINYDLIRLLLLQIEEITDGHTNFMPEYFFDKFPEYGQEELDYHLKFLSDASLIEAYDHTVIIDITHYGRNYLDSIRDKSIWQKTKEKIQPFESVALSVISDIGLSLIKKQLGL